MGARENLGTNVDQSLIQRVVAGIRYAVSGVGPESWFGPMQPLAPQAQDKTEGRAFDYPVGYNQRIQPREGELPFYALRQVADGYDLLRLVIETRKDQIESFDWEIVPKDKGKSASAMQGDIDRVTEFLASPDQEHNWAQWLRMQIEDLLVLDAIAVYPRQNRGGKLYGFELVDPATLKRVIDDTGRTPLPPDPAYQQVLKGIPAADYSKDQLVYTMRNPRTNRIYGYSPVEQVMMTVNIALRRQMSQLDFYTAGNVPEALAQVPDNWTMKQIQEFQLWWDSINEGNSSAKRKMRFLPMLKDIVFPKKEVLKDEFDEWLARIVCFAFSISPSALIKQVNRASGEQMADTAKEEGLMPLLRFLESHITSLIQKYADAQNLKFQFKVVNRVTPTDQATIDKTYVDLEVMTPDEVRENLNMDAMTPEQREAAFPTPVPPGFNPDGTPILPKGAAGNPDPNAAGGDDGAAPGGTPAPKPAPKPPPADAPAAAKVDVSDLLKTMFDGVRAIAPPEPAVETPPSASLAEMAKVLGETVADALRQQYEQFISIFKLHVNDVNDRVRAEPPTIIEHKPVTKVEIGDTRVDVHAAKPDPAVAELTKLVLESNEANAARADASHVALIKLVDAQQLAKVAPAEPAALPEVHLHAPITINMPTPHVDVEILMPEQGATRQTIERDRDGNITEITTKPAGTT